MSDWRDPIHPGEILAGELEEIDLNASQLAEKLGVTKNRIYLIIEGKRSITADTALRLGRFFGTGPELWLNLQKSYELDVARHEADRSIERIEPYRTLEAVPASL